jgi:hypothetical protein
VLVGATLAGIVAAALLAGSRGRRDL